MTIDAAKDMSRPTLRALTASGAVGRFELLVEDMEAEFGDLWGDLDIEAALALLRAGIDVPEILVLMLCEEDEDEAIAVSELVVEAVSREVTVLIASEDVSPKLLNSLVQLGAARVLPYPLPEGALHEALRTLGARRAAVSAETAPAAEAEPAAPARAAAGDGAGRDGVVFAVQGLSGGVGATTFAASLAWELALCGKGDSPRVCLLDLDLQRGSVGTYLDLPLREAVLELLTNTEAMDQESFLQALQHPGEVLHVLTAPPEMVPLDLIAPDDIARLIAAARSRFDYVVIDMPPTVVQWTETVLLQAHLTFALIALEMRSAQNAQRFLKALQAEELPVERLRFALNRAPGFADLSGKARVKRLAETLGIAIEVQLPDGGRAVATSQDAGTPLAQSARKNVFRRAVAQLAASLHAVGQPAAKAR